jgi:hypothetical protein
MGAGMYTTADDWLARFKAAGCTLMVDAAGIRPEEGVPLSDKCRAIWAELQGQENKPHWDEVIAEVRSRVGPFVGWTKY